MRIVHTELGANYQGLLNGIKDKHDTCFAWNHLNKPAFDLFDEVVPELVLCDINFVTQEFLDAANESDAKIIWFGKALQEGFTPDLVVIENSIPTVLKKHLENGIAPVFYLNAFADLVKYSGGVTDERLTCDVGFVCSSFDPAKMKTWKLLLEIGHRFNMKVVGHPVPVPYYLGRMEDSRYIDFLKSSAIALDIDGGNLINNAANGIFTVSNVVNKLFPTITLKDYDEVISHHLDCPEVREKITKEAQTMVLQSDTVYHRLADIFDMLYLPEEHSYYSEKANQCALV